jgi:hypothetical protein
VICPYGPHNSAEWNHCQPTSLKIILAENPLRETITAAGPVSLEGMFEAGNSLVEGAADITGAVGKDSPVRATVLASANVKAQRPSRNREDDEDGDDDKPKHKRNGRVADIAGAVGKDLPVRVTAQASASVKAKRPSRNREEDEDDDDDKPRHKRNGRVAERRAADKDL